jgi:hypothetical protein
MNRAVSRSRLGVLGNETRRSTPIITSDFFPVAVGCYEGALADISDGEEALERHSLPPPVAVLAEVVELVETERT